MSQSRPDISVNAAFDDSGIGTLRGRSLLERSDLVPAFARVLHANGQSTYQTLAAAGRLANGLGLSATIIAGGKVCRFGRRTVTLGWPPSLRPAPPAWTWTASPAPTWLFALAAAAGAAALSVIFGVEHLGAIALIVASSADGAVLRRAISRHSTNALLQPLCAALLAALPDESLFLAEINADRVYLHGTRP